MSKKRG